MVTRGESITKSLDPGSAALSRDALAKIVYSKLFDWLVTKINNSIGQDPSSEYIIGVLDIYGFESFKTNSFEQFCINLTNEKLQQHFNQHVFKMEQEEYTKEEIDWSYIEFIDNQDVLDLIEKKPGGIIALIDEACMFPKSTHDTLAQKLYQTFNGHKRFTKPKLARTDFTICHYAGDVTYQTELFLDKNKDYVVREHQALMNSSDCSFVSSLFPKLRLESSNSSKFSSIGSQFKQQLQSLLETLNTTEPHYIRCVKPNNVLKPEIFENINVLHQLRCGGVLEAIRISCAGYPTRKPFSEFLTRFRILFPEAANKRVMVTRGESITKSLDPGSAALSRDALAKIVYSKLFDWLVTKINNSIGQDPSSEYIIGVLDIYGFESFKTNSFEQFCINLTNEKLQQHFNQHVFKMEQEEYTKEEIDWSYIEFIDNQDVLDLIEKKPGGIIALIDEACMFPKSTHDTLAQKLYQTFNGHKRFTKPKLARTDFTICHYAGDVTYQTELFLDKNKDYVVREHQALMNSSDCSFVSSLFPKLRLESSNSSKFSSIGSQFKQQLQSLLETLNTTEPHYIRCVKPNNVLKPEIFENINVLHQLRCGGVLEAIRISCAGYPTRKPFSEFLTRFRILFPEAANKSFDEVDACKKLLAKVELKGFQVTYQTELFLDKNKDYVVREHQALMNSSDCSFVSSLFPKLRLESSNSSKFSSIGSQFKQQLQSLLETLNTTEPHYIRCVKPNNVLKPEIFENINVLHQLRCGGVLEAIRISCAGYPTRKPFSEFLTRFRILFPEAANKSFDEVDACKKLLAKVELKGFQIGKTKVFLRAGQMAELDAHRSEALGHSARIIQRKVLTYQSRKKYMMLQSASRDIQAFCRGRMARLQFESMRREAASLRIQKQARTYICQTAYKNLCISAVYIQTELRAMAALVELQYRKKRHAAIIIQAKSNQKMSVSSSVFKNEESSYYHSAAKETGALQETNTKLEKELKELTSILELEKQMRMELEEAKNQEVEELKAALNDMKLQLGETQETKSEEILKLQSALQDMQLEFEELAKDLEMTHDLAAENENLKELVSSLQRKTDESETNYEETGKQSEKQEVPVIDNDDLVDLLEKKIIETEKKYEEASRLCEERLQKVVDTENKLEEKVSDMETEDKILRQQALAHSASRKMSPQMSFTGHPPMENGHHASLAPVPSRRFGTISFRRSRIERQPHEYLDVLIKFVSQKVGFSHGKPVAAFTIYKCLIHWKVFEAEKTSIFDRMVPVFGSAIEALSTQQLYRICTLCKIDDDKDQNVSPDVISNLKLLITDEDEDSRSFSLDNDSSIPFAADEISNCMQEKEFTNVKAAVELADNPNFHFLKD
ncbi:hypothetical protein F2Q68_00001335 [Brassica cretica]|uniref:Myosin motor domain-containing protein n=1 Tax=Brassica cretica TaxID=69181 RepID=A0A8S9J5P4_BRACR|nr:hypothetical protein F2Q68_00001335 [Brassica cretica]